MRAIQIASPKQLQRIESADPGRPGPGQVLVRTHAMGICGTDISAFLGKFPFFDYPRIPGHELGVEVLEVADDVSHVCAGDRCSVEPYLNCGECFACRRGHGNCCTRLSVIGVMQDGGLCDRFLIRADKLHPAGKLSFEQLALVETLAIGAHAVERGAPEAGDNVLIIGAGPIGLAALEFARLAGAEVIVMDLVQSRLDFCRKTYGVSHTIVFENPEQAAEQLRDLTGGDMVPLVIDATGNRHSMSGALEFVAHSGRLVFLGVCSDEISFPQPSMHRRELTLLASRNALPGDFTRIIELMEAGQIDTGPWITHRSTFERIVDEFATYTRPESGVIKAVVDVAG